MKKIMAVFLAALLAAALTAPALADVIWEPMDDFYAEHRDECTYVNARYEARTDAVIYATPEDRTQVAVIAAGESVFINDIWNGGAWGSVSGYRDENGNWAEGWVELGGFRKRYGETDFEADHRDEIIEVDGDLTITKEEPVYFWTFPGSGEVAGTFGGPESWMDEETVSFNRVWTDGDGHDWGQLGYFYGLRDVWVYLPDTHTDSLPATAPRYAEEEPADPAPGGNAARAAAPAEHSTVGPMVTAVVILMAVTVVVICVIRPKNGKGRKER